jgi:3-carboxy-cis,cis-muconate cycloisomerase
MSDVFTTRGRIRAMLEVEAALAEVQSALGVIPSTAAKPIRDAARAELYDDAALAEEGRRAGNLAIPLVRSLTERVGTTDADAARYVHWGATSQDIIDTGLVLQLRESVPRVLTDLERAANAAAAHAKRHSRTVMAGRTWLQQSTPITFGLKSAGWFDALTRVRRNLRDSLERTLVLQFGGASGTLAALGPRGTGVADALGARLQLDVPALPWHTHRDRIAMLACALGVAAGTLGKIGRDLALLAQTEVDEVHDRPEDAGGSSTMPQKQNPVHAATAVAVATRAPGLVATILSAMPQEHERGLGHWQAEWDSLPSLITAVAESAAAIAASLEGLIVNPARMTANLDITHGLIMAEAVTMRLAPRLGKANAHAIVAAACRRAIEERRHLREVLLGDASVTAVLSEAEIADALSPEHYLGAAETFITNALNQGQRGE